MFKKLKAFWSEHSLASYLTRFLIFIFVALFALTAIAECVNMRNTFMLGVAWVSAFATIWVEYMILKSLIASTSVQGE